MVEEIPIAPLNSLTLRSEFTLHRGAVLNPFLSKPSHLQGWGAEGALQHAAAPNLVSLETGRTIGSLH